MNKIRPVMLLAVLISGCTAGKSGTGDLPPTIIDLSKPTVTPGAIATGPMQVGTPVPAAPTPVIPPTPSALSPEAQVVAAQIDAFNKHDLEAFLATYSPHAVLYDHPDRVRASGVGEIRQAYASALANNPALRVSVSSRITEGRFVTQQESLTGAADGSLARNSMVIYEIVDGKIAKVWFVR
jgi:hypothetical protein